MKKIIALTSMLLIMAASAFAASLSPDAAGQKTLAATAPANLNIVKLSKGVVLGATYETTDYALDTYHLQGTKFYGTAADSTAIYFYDAGTSASLAAPTTSMSTAFTGWTKM